MTAIPKNWNAGKAWMCVASLIAMQVGLVFIVVLVSHLIIGRSLNGDPIASFVLNAATGLLAVFITLLFARPRTMEQFTTFFALKRPESKTAITLIALGAGLAGVAVLLAKRWGSAPHNPLVESFSTSGPTGIAWLRFVLIAAAFIEEFIVRGYLYPAFRQSYSIPFSVISVLAIAVLNHFAPVSSSIVFAIALILLNIMLCLVREKTGSLWNCVLCHTAYNIVCALT